MTKTAFLDALRTALLARYATPEKVGQFGGWANDAVALDRFMSAARETIERTENGINIDGPAFVEAGLRSCCEGAQGLVGRPALAA